MRSTFLRRLAVHACLAFLISLSVSYCFESNVSRREVRNLITANFNEQLEYSQNARQTYSALDQNLKANALVNARSIARLIQLDPTLLEQPTPGDDSRLIELARAVGVDEIDIANSDGVIERGIPACVVGFEYKKSNRAKEFLKILDNQDLEIVQPIRQSEGTNEQFFQYAATKRLDAPGFVEIGMNAKELRPIFELANMSNYVSSHIGREGFMAVFFYNAEENALILTSVGKNTASGEFNLPNELQEALLDDGKTLPIDRFDIPCDKLFSCRVGNRRYSALAQWKEDGKLLFVGGLPNSEIFAEKSLRIVLTLAGNFVVFLMVFIFIARLVQSLFVNSVAIVNRSLKIITSGNLRERVKVTVTKEFADLSDGINATVDSLKDAAEEVERKTHEEMALARRIQESTFPNLEARFENSPVVDVYGCNLPQASVGGDAFDFFLVDDSTIFFYVADVAGSGVSAALVAMKLTALVNNLALSNLPLKDIVETTNRFLTESAEVTLASGFFCMLDLRTGIVEYIDAGHPFPTIRRNNENFKLLQVERSIILGSDVDATFPTSTFTLSLGDSLLLYTDGLKNSLNLHSNDAETINKFLSLFNHLPHDASAKYCVEYLFQEVERVTRSPTPPDDETALYFRFLNYIDEQESSAF